MGRIAPVLAQPLIHLFAIGQPLGDRVNKHEVHIGPGGGQRFPCFRRAGLHQQWMALRRARDVERAAHAKVLALILEMMHLVGIGK